MTMTPADSSEVRIRNRRYRPWGTLVGGMLVVMIAVTVGMLFVVDRQYDRLVMRLLAVILLGMVVYTAHMGLIALDLMVRSRPKRRETARAVWDWVVRGIRPADPFRVRAAVVLTLFGWLTPRCLTVDQLALGDSLAFDSRLPVPATAVRQIRFAPDPAEDYAEPDRPERLCAATVEFEWGREFRLTVDEADARRLRQWAESRAIPVSDLDGYQPIPSEASVHERS
jgi:hypothetical protein